MVTAPCFSQPGLAEAAALSDTVHRGCSLTGGLENRARPASTAISFYRLPINTKRAYFRRA